MKTKLTDWADRLDEGYRMGLLQPMLEVAEEMRALADLMELPHEKGYREFDEPQIIASQVTVPENTTKTKVPVQKVKYRPEF